MISPKIFLNFMKNWYALYGTSLQDGVSLHTVVVEGYWLLWSMETPDGSYILKWPAGSIHEVEWESPISNEEFIVLKLKYD